MSEVTEIVDVDTTVENGATTEVAEISTVKTTLVCPHCQKEIIFERPAAQRRGQLAGLKLDDMTAEQLKREKINASSVLYKATQRKAEPATIQKNQERLDAVLAEIAKRNPAPVVVATEEVVVTGEENVEAVTEEVIADSEF